MCYSAKILQDLKQYLREVGAHADLAQIEETFRRRLADKSVRIPRGFERNFDNPSTPPEQRTHDLIDQHRATSSPKLAQDIFTQRKRLADAERSLKTKQTKKALEDGHIATGEVGTTLEKLSLLNATQAHPDDGRIFPKTYGHIVKRQGHRNVVELGRDHLRDPGKPPAHAPQFHGPYNAV